MLCDVKEFILFNGLMVNYHHVERQLNLERYLDERKGKEVLGNV